MTPVKLGRIPQRQCRERREPMRPDVMPAGDMRQRRRQVTPGDRFVTHPETAQAPGARERQAIQVALLRIGAIGGHRRRGERTEARRQECGEPRRELPGRQHRLHQHGLDQGRRKEIVERRLVGERRVPVPAIPAQGGAADLFLQDRVPCHGGIVERENARERGIAVAAGADRMGGTRDEPTEARREERRERAKGVAPVAHAVPEQLRVQLEQPCPSVGPLEGPSGRRLQVRELGGERFLRQVPVELGADGCGFPNSRQVSEDARQKPMHVHRRMPAEAAEERRMDLPWREIARRRVQQVIHLARELARHVAQREARENAAERFVENGHGRVDIKLESKRYLMSLELIVLAAGQGKRMHSALPKVLHRLAGRPLLAHVLQACRALAPKRILVVHGHGGEQVKLAFKGEKLAWIEQSAQLGTGHAVNLAREVLEKKAENIIVLYGDHPFVSPETIKNLRDKHIRSGKKITMATVKLPDFKDWRINFVSFSRIIRDASGNIIKDVQFKDASDAEIKVTEVNPCYFCFDASWLWENLTALKNFNAQNEYYLTDLIKIATESDMEIESIDIDPREALGANTRAELLILEKFAT